MNLTFTFCYSLPYLAYWFYWPFFPTQSANGLTHLLIECTSRTMFHRLITLLTLCWLLFVGVQRPWPELENKVQIMFKVGTGNIPKTPDTLSPEGQDFLEHCLQVSPDHRWTSSQLKSHLFVAVSRLPRVCVGIPSKCVPKIAVLCRNWIEIFAFRIPSGASLSETTSQLDFSQNSYRGVGSKI